MTFKHGGLKRLLSQQPHRPVLFSPVQTSRARSLLVLVSRVQTLVFGLAEELLSVSLELRLDRIHQVLDQLVHQTELFVHVLKDELVRTALQIHHQHLPRGSTGTRSTRTRSTRTRSTGGSTGSRSTGSRSTRSRSTVESPSRQEDEEDWDRTWTNVDLSLHCIIAMVDRLGRSHVDRVQDSKVDRLGRSHVDRVQDSKVDRLGRSHVDQVQDSKVDRVQDSKVDRVQDSKVDRVQDSKVDRLGRSHVDQVQDSKVDRLGRSQVDRVQDSKVDRLGRSQVDRVQDSKVDRVQDSKVDRVQDSPMDRLPVDQVQDSTLAWLRGSNVDRVQDSLMVRLGDSPVDQVQDSMVDSRVQDSRDQDSRDQDSRDQDSRDQDSGDQDSRDQDPQVQDPRLGGSWWSWSWQDQLLPLVLTLRDCVREAESRSRTALAFVVLHEAAVQTVDRGPAQLVQRRHAVFSQALAPVVCGFLLRLSRGLDQDQVQVQVQDQDQDQDQVQDFLLQLVHVGVLVQFEGLLSTYADELGMLEDMVVGVADLGSVTFRVIESGSDLPEDLQPRLRGDWGSLVVLVPLPPATFRSLPQEVQDGTLIRIHPVLFNIGINQQQSLAQRFGDCSLQDQVNQQSSRRLRDYCDSLRARLPHTRTRTLSDLLDSLDRSLESKKRKNVEVLWTAAAVCREVCGVRLTSCKSAKDRTSMSVTLEQCVLLRDRHTLRRTHFSSALDLMRRAGCRMENVVKNVGTPRFSFSSVQLLTFPRLYRPPEGSFGPSL